MPQGARRGTQALRAPAAGATDLDDGHRLRRSLRIAGIAQLAQMAAIFDEADEAAFVVETMTSALPTHRDRE